MKLYLATYDPLILNSKKTEEIVLHLIIDFNNSEIPRYFVVDCKGVRAAGPEASHSEQFLPIPLCSLARFSFDTFSAFSEDSIHTGGGHYS